VWRGLDGLSPPIGVLQNDMAPTSIDNAPLFDLFQGSKAADADEVIVQAAITHARGLSGAVDITHWCKAQLRGFQLDHAGEGKSGNASHGGAAVPG
jgi:hypothetical protein